MWLWFSTTVADDPQMLSCMQWRKHKYTSLQIQNELLKLLAASVLREITTSIQKAKLVSIMADEVTDTLNQEKVDKAIEPHEHFAGIHASKISKLIY